MRNGGRMSSQSHGCSNSGTMRRSPGTRPADPARPGSRGPRVRRHRAPTARRTSRGRTPDRGRPTRRARSAWARQPSQAGAWHPPATARGLPRGPIDREDGSHEFPFFLCRLEFGERLHDGNASTSTRQQHRTAGLTRPPNHFAGVDLEVTDGNHVFGELDRRPHPDLLCVPLSGA